MIVSMYMNKIKFKFGIAIVELRTYKNLDIFLLFKDNFLKSFKLSL